MSDLLEKIAVCCERGKVDKDAIYPPDMKGEDGVDELTRQALDSGISANAVLTEGLMPGMQRIGTKFSNNEAFVPDLLMAAKAMGAGMVQLQPYFETGEARHRGTIALGTVQGDLHDIGKNLVRMILEGGGWKVIDLGVDTSAEKFLAAMEANPGCAIGISALLTTTMMNMETVVQAIKEKYPESFVMVGGAPLTQAFSDKIGADAYAPDPQAALERLNHAA